MQKTNSSLPKPPQESILVGFFIGQNRFEHCPSAGARYIKDGDLGNNIVVIQEVSNCFAHKN